MIYEIGKKEEEIVLKVGKELFNAKLHIEESTPKSQKKLLQKYIFFIFNTIFQNQPRYYIINN